MSPARSLTFICMILCVCACQGPTPRLHFSRFVPPADPAGASCVLACGTIKESCDKKCAVQERQCTYAMQTEAVAAYHAYVKDQRAQGQPVQSTPRDFEKPWDCQPVSCLEPCAARYEDCYRGCGGRVLPASGCGAVCPE